MDKSQDLLHVITVVELVDSNPLSQLEDFLHMQIKFNEELERHAETLLAKHADKCHEAKVQHWETHILRGREPKYEIEAWVSALNIENVVLSRRGHSEGEKAGAMGSVSDYCLQHLPNNVIVVK
eukprot:c5566_g1_i1.p1 GENE.c5566_g1_i1~~c5566_g1_i1.p1  ORF type:complete len:124 (+),score=22.25 c5566_g1_i1:294-665(+)